MIKQKRFIKSFQRAGAIDEAHACSLDELHLRMSPLFRRMVIQGIFIACSDDRYYLNVPVATLYQSGRQYFLRIIFLLFLILLLAFITGILLK